jgi:Gpi18-like mannosyltransferase
MLKTVSRFLMDAIASLKKAPLKDLALLIILALASVSVSITTAYRYFHVNQSGEFIRVNGFQKYFEATNGQGEVLITQDNIRMGAENGSFMEVIVYSAVEDFRWSFSASPLEVSGLAFPVAFAIEWGQKNISVWAETGKGWYYYSNVNASLAQNKVPIGGSVVVGSRYEIEVNWSKSGQTKNVVATILLRDQAWQRILVFTIPETYLPPSLAIQTYTSQGSYTLVDYSENVLLTYTSRYEQETYNATVISALASVLFVCVAGFVCFNRLSELAPFLESWLRGKVGRLREIVRRLPNYILLYVKDNRAFIYLVVFFAAIRIGLALTTPSHWFDSYAFKAWINVIRDRGVAMIYPYTAILPPIIIRPVYPYPPVIAYVLSSFAPLSPQNTSTNNVLLFLLKVPPILADLALGWAIYYAVKSWKGYKAGLIAATLSLLNFVNSSIWGQYDSIVALFMVLAALAIVKEKIELGWLLAALAVSTKETALPFVPGLLIVSIKKRGWFSTFLGVGVFCLTVMVIWSPLLLSGYSLDFALWQMGLGLLSSTGAFSPASSEMTATTVFAPNIWPLINWLKDGVPPRMAFFGAVNDNVANQFFFLSYFQLGILLFLAFYCFTLFSLRRSSNDQNVMFKLSLLMVVFYMFPTRMHERYLFLALPFLVLAYKESKVALISYLSLLVAFSINLLSALSVQWVPNEFLNFFSFLPYASDAGLLCLVLVNLSITLFMVYHSLRK